MENTANTFTKISNSELESWYTDPDYPMFIRVQLFIIRMTSGFHRTKFNTSRQRIADAIGHGGCLTLITRATNKLVKKGIITKRGSWITLSATSTNNTKSYPQATQPTSPKNHKCDTLSTPEVRSGSHTINKTLNKELSLTSGEIEIQKFRNFCLTIGASFTDDRIKYEFEKFLTHNLERPNTKVKCNQTALKYFENWLKQCHAFEQKGIEMAREKEEKQQVKAIQPSERPKQTWDKQPSAERPKQTWDKQPSAGGHPQSGEKTRQAFEQGISSNASKIAEDFAAFKSK